MPRINCYVPIKLCITGRVNDAQLDDLSATLVRAISARIAFAERTITTSENGLSPTSKAEVRGPYNSANESSENNSYNVPSYDRGGRPVALPVRRRRRPWFIRKAINFHATVGNFLDLVERLTPNRSLPSKVLYMDQYADRRWVSLWLVQVNEEFTLTQLEPILSERAERLFHQRSDQVLAYAIGTHDGIHRRISSIDEDRSVSSEIPTLSARNARRVMGNGPNTTILPGGWVLFAGMVLPKLEDENFLIYGSEQIVSLPLHVLDFIVDPASFQRRFGVSWDSYVNEYGDRLITLRMLAFTILRRVHYDALKFLVEPHVTNSVDQYSASFGNLYLLNQSRIDWLPQAARPLARHLTNERTLALDESRRQDWWDSGWSGAYIYAVVNATGPQPSSPVAERANLQDPETPERLIDRYTSYWNLDEEGLGFYLVDLIRRSPAFSHYVQRVFDELGTTNRDDVALAFAENTIDADLDMLAQSPNGRLLLGRLYDELTSGEYGSDEQRQAERLLNARLRARSVELVARRAETARGWIFPYRQGGPTVYDDSPITATLQHDGRIRVRLMSRVGGTAEFRDEVATLPRAVFEEGLVLEPDEWIRVKLYDEGGIIVDRPALYLLEISNQGVTKTLHTVATVVATVATFGGGSVAAGAGWGVRVLAALDRAANVLGVIAILVNDHRGWIISTFGEDGRAFIRSVELANTIAGAYGIARLAISTPRIIVGLRDSWRNWRMSAAYGRLQGSDLRRAEELSQNVAQFINSADEAAAAAQAEAAAAATPTGVHTEPHPSTSSSGAPQRLPGASGEPPNLGGPPSSGGPSGSGGTPTTPTLLQRQRAAALRSDASALEREAASLRSEADVIEQRASNVQATKPDRAERLRRRSAQMRRVATRLQDEINAARTEAIDFESGARSATAEFPDSQEFERLFETAQSDIPLVQVPLQSIERNPAFLPRLVRTLMRSRSGHRVVFRVDGGGSRGLIRFDPATRNVTLARDQTLHLNFGSPERALEFIRANRGQGSRLVIFEMDEQWVRSFRSGAVPEHGTTALPRTQRSVDVTAAEDQLQIPGDLIDEVQQFIIPGSAREFQITEP
jgi:hypothetical protein